MGEPDYTALLTARDRQLIAAAGRPAQSSAAAALPYQGPPVFIGFDAEWVTVDGPRPANAVLSYQLALECGGRRIAVVVYTKGRDRHHRLRLSTLLETAFRHALRKRVIPALPDKVSILGHFIRADLTTIQDFWPTLKHALAGVGRTVISPRGIPVILQDDDTGTSSQDGTATRDRGAEEDDAEGRLYRGERVVVRDAQRRPHPILVRFIDTMLLTPGRAGLALAGRMIGLEKLSLPTGHSINRMDLLLQQDRAAFEVYALRDAEIALEYGLRMDRLACEELGLRRLPATLAAFGVAVFGRDLRKRGILLRDTFGLVEEKERQFNERTGRYRTVRRDIPCFGRRIHDDFAREAYHGGRNECFAFGPTEVGVWYDFDLPGAYTTAMCWLRPLDYAKARQSIDPADFEPGVMGVAKVRFLFPPDTRFPSLPVSTPHGLVFPLAGESVCTSPEIALARSSGAEVEIQHGLVVPWAPGEPLFEPFTRLVQERRRAAVKGSIDDLLWKEIGNSLYGKTAQGVRGSHVFDPASGKSRPVGPSAITNPWFAAWTTGFVRAVLSETLAGVPSHRTVVSATTDGLLTDAPLEELRLDGPLCSMFADIRERLFGDRRVLEEKHRVAQVLPFKTRGQITAMPIAGHPILLAKAGVKPPCPPDEHNDYMLDLFLERQPGQVHTLSHLISTREMWLSEFDMVAVSRLRRLNLEFDMKRRPVEACSRAVAGHHHLAFSTAPWRTAVDAVAEMVLFEGWRKTGPRVLKSEIDFAEWQGYSAVRASVRGRGLVVRSDGPAGVLKRQFLRALVREVWGLSMEGWTYQDVAVWLATRGYETSSTDVKNAKRANAVLVPHSVPLVPEVMELLRVILANFPSFDLDAAIVEADVLRARAALQGLAVAGDEPNPS